MKLIKKVLSISFVFILFVVVFSCRPKLLKADTIVIYATIWTGNDEQPYAEAMAILNDTIFAIGTIEEIEELKGTNTKIIDVQGKFITPGFIDTHVHLMMGGNSLLSVELRDANTPEEFTRRIAAYAKSIKPNRWIVEGNWDHTLWGGELPKKEWIDTDTEQNPVVVYRLDGHMVLANSLALKIAGIDKNTPNVKGGKIIKDKNGIPTGILKGNAMNQLLEKIPPMSASEKEKALKAATKYLLSNGVTSVHDVDSLGTYAVAKKLRDNNELGIRIYKVSTLNNPNQIQKVDQKDEKWLKTNGVKGFIDGSLGSHTAAFKKGYTDVPKDKGFFIYPEKKVAQWIRNADKKNLQVLVHAIGDSAIHTVLNIYENVINEHGEKDRRFRIEHAQHLDPEDIKRFGTLNIIASMQPYHAIDDGRWAEELIGAKRVATTYAFKSLLEAKTILSFGSDWPVAPASPLLGIYAATTRRTLDDKNPNGWIPEQKISAEEALLAYTKNAAYASFEEKIKGTLMPGKLADFVIMSGDITTVNLANIKDIKILQTYVGGKKVFDTHGY